MEKIYLSRLEELKKLSDSLPNTPMMVQGKLNALIALNMRYEKIMLDRSLEQHPYLMVDQLVQDSYVMMQTWRDIDFIENKATKSIQYKQSSLEVGHHSLFQKLWTQFSTQEYQQRIERYVKRLQVNNLYDGRLESMRCIDFGCGHGNFAHALLKAGASYVFGVDYGEDSIEFACKMRDELGISQEQLEFHVGSVYDVPTNDNSFDFAIQNGVFHHLEDEDTAYKEVSRTLKTGGWFWVYTDGEGGISYDLWDASVYMLRDVPYDFVVEHLKQLNIETGKRYHLGDGLNAVYRHTSWNQITKRLDVLGFGNFKRLTGGFDTDFDLDVIEADPYGREKFGEGDLRILAQLVEK